ncbi:MAG TPA: hypothetical protein VEF92_08675 [Burkholderiales bacterium]|nr:hypothetical protein [Burkholderiales bacterium]
MISANVWAAWISILLGMLSGTVQGLYFYREDWLGGYGSWARRLMRLGHISFFGVAFLNLAYADSVRLFGAATHVPLASALLIGGAALMPLACYLAAWRKPLRHLFPLPVLCLLGAALAFIAGQTS